MWYCKGLREILFATDDVSIPGTKCCGIQWMILLFCKVMEVPWPGLSWVPYLQDLKIASQITGGTDHKSRWHHGPWELYSIYQQAVFSDWS